MRVVGAATDSVLGVDVPGGTYWSELATPVRAHDVGLDELLTMVPIAIFAFALFHRRLRAGMTAAIVAIIYALTRFGLDFLRLPPMEPYGRPSHARGFAAGRESHDGAIATGTDARGAERGQRTRRRITPEASDRGALKMHATGNPAHETSCDQAINVT